MSAVARPADQASGLTGLRCKLVRCCSTSRAPGAIVSDISRAETIAQVPLTFSDWKPIRHLEDPLHKDLSAVTRIGDCLFLACDETASVERLRRLDDGSFGDHQHVPLGALVGLPAGAEGEMDIEGLCADGGFLWIVGSHSRKRSKPKRDENDHTEALQKMGECARFVQ
jgi:hypothetical protein